MLHEIVHVLLRDLEVPKDQDWIQEGLAEYLSLQALKDSGTISALRYRAALTDLRRQGSAVVSLRDAGASGPATARG